MLHLFEGYGIELEYMIVHKDNLAVTPVSDLLLHQAAGNKEALEVAFGDIAWSNELVLHVIELKSNGPAVSLPPLVGKFQENIRHINQILARHQAMLMPGGVHPLMNPYKETKLWPYGQNEIYEQYNKIFDCRGHGWSNLQSTHINLPFANDAEFARLHAAIRLLLPIIPALTASSPILEGKVTGFSDTRLDVYRKNQQKVEAIAGHVIPERAFSKTDYETLILQKMYEAIDPFDPDKILQDEWLNSRGAIARFDRNAIEIRIIDTQECPLADITCALIITSILKALVAETWMSLEQQMLWDEKELAQIFLCVIKEGGNTLLDHEEYLKSLGYTKSPSCTAQELWAYLIDHVAASELKKNPALSQAAQTLKQQGNLSSRILRAVGNNTSPENIRSVYHKLANCLATGTLFAP